jgi:hypothetical protein
MPQNTKYDKFWNKTIKNLVLASTAMSLVSAISCGTRIFSLQGVGQKAADHYSTIKENLQNMV